MNLFPYNNMDELYQQLDDVLRIEKRCNQECEFCNVMYAGEDHVPDSMEELKRKIDQYASSGSRVLSITGGEPLLHDGVFELISYAKSKGLYVKLQTNATLIDMETAHGLKQSGLDACFIPLLSSDAGMHAQLKRHDSLDQTLSGLQNVLDAGIAVIINILVTQKNYLHIVDLIHYIHDTFPAIKQVSLSFVQPHGRAAQNISLLPHYLGIKKNIQEIIHKLHNYRFNAVNPYCGIPLCIWQNQYLDFSHCLEYQQNSLIRNNTESMKTQGDLIRKEKKHNEKCINCYVKNYCNGYWKEYDQVFSDPVVEPVCETYKYFE